MVKSRITGLKSDVAFLLARFPLLECRNSPDDSIIISGPFSAVNYSSGEVLGRFEVAMTLTPKYPYRFPSVIETSERIPRIADRHINSDGTICFCAPQDEVLFCKNGISLLQFAEEVLNPHLLREVLWEEDKCYRFGERSHGSKGIWEWFYEELRTDDKSQVIQKIEQSIKNISESKNAICYCGSGRQYKRCHYIKPSSIDKLGSEHLKNFLQYLKQEQK